MGFLMKKTFCSGKYRQIVRRTAGVAASDGDGVRLKRIIGSPELDMIDPFLLLDSFESDQPQDYIGGFPDHPHRGFETVTYILDGCMRHKDSAGNEGVINPGGVQWMTAGRGIVHSEMPEQENGLLHGFQLWINLPAAAKMTVPAYQEFQASEIPIEILSTGGTVKVISGQTDQGTIGPVKNTFTEPLYLDISLSQGTVFEQDISSAQGGFVYVIEGCVHLGEVSMGLLPGNLGILGDGDKVQIHSCQMDSRLLLISAKRLNEAVARGGPFIMNTRQQVLEAIRDFEQGRF